MDVLHKHRWERIFCKSDESGGLVYEIFRQNTSHIDFIASHTSKLFLAASKIDSMLKKNLWFPHSEKHIDETCHLKPNQGQINTHRNTNFWPEKRRVNLVVTFASANMFYGFKFTCSQRLKYIGILCYYSSYLCHWNIKTYTNYYSKHGDEK